MKLDPNKACENQDQLFLWAIAHDLLAHAFMALTLYSAWSLRFHDWTSHKAWPDQGRPRVRRTYGGMWECYGKGLHSFGLTEQEARTRWSDFVVKMTRPHKTLTPPLGN